MCSSFSWNPAHVPASIARMSCRSPAVSMSSSITGPGSAVYLLREQIAESFTPSWTSGWSGPEDMRESYAQPGTYDEPMTIDEAFFTELSAINSDLESSSARIDQVLPNNGDVGFVSLEDTETLEAITKFQAAQKRLSALLASVKD